MNRGSLRGGRERGSVRTCFNEAPIHESGKFALAEKYVVEEDELQ